MIFFEMCHVCRKKSRWNCEEGEEDTKLSQSFSINSRNL